MRSISHSKEAILRRLAHRATNRRIQTMGLRVRENAPSGEGVLPVVFFNASTRLENTSQNAAFSLLASWGLRLSGTPVMHFVCGAGMRRCVLGTNRDDPQAEPPCRQCISQSVRTFTGAKAEWCIYQADEELDAALEGLDLAELISLVYGDLPLGELVLSSLRWTLRRHHLVDDEPTRFLCRQFLVSAWSIARKFSALLDKVKPQAVVVFNGMFFPEATVRYLAQQRGIRVVTHEVGFRPLSGFFTPGEATASPIDLPEDFILTQDQEKTLDGYLEQRFQGNFQMAGVRFWPEMNGMPSEFWEKAKAFQQVVPVFTNVVFDTSQTHANVIFPHMFAWLDLVLEEIRSHPETLFVLRAHPDETRPGKESRESVAQWVERHQVDRLPNVYYLDADQYIDSYELIRASKFTMVYNSTIGLEAAILGSTVLCGGKSRFTQDEIAILPESEAAFRQKLEELLNCDQVETPEAFRENARRFFYYQVFHRALPFGEFLEEDKYWKGYVRLKNFDWQALLPENSQTMQVIVKGILEGEPFAMPERK
jgi:hypothetical protein